jgi:hypothetical protein
MKAVPQACGLTRRCSRPLRARDRAHFDWNCMRSRQLNGTPFGTRGGVIIIPFSFWMWRIGLPEGALCLIRRAGARYAGCGTNARCADGAWCRAWYDGPLCRRLVEGNVTPEEPGSRSTSVVPGVIPGGRDSRSRPVLPA